MQYRGVIHAMEFHNSSLPDAQVLDVVRQMASQIVSGTPPPTCRDCTPGQIDHDSDPTTECEPCPVGRYSAAYGAHTCNETCPIGSTITTQGASTAADCSPCAAGKHGGAAGNMSVCVDCLAGRTSSTTGADNAVACSDCPAGMFSKPGTSAGCEPVGCTDEWATNFLASARVDDGLCSYDCLSLLARAAPHYTTMGQDTTGQRVVLGQDVIDLTGLANFFAQGDDAVVDTTATACLIHDPIAGWEHFAANGSKFKSGEGVITEISHGQLLIQGRPTASFAPSDHEYVSYPSGFSVSADRVNVTIRYVAFGGDTATSCVDFSGRDRSGINERVVRIRLQHTRCTARASSENQQLEYGAGMSVSNPRAATTSSVVFEFVDSIINNNVADAHGAGIQAVFSPLDLRLLHMHIDENQAGDGGGAHIASGCAMRVGHSSFARNRARYGGALFVEAAATADISHSTFFGNMASVFGGGIRVAGMGGLILSNCDLRHNGAARVGAALHVTRPISFKVMDTAFVPFLAGAQVVSIHGTLAGCADHPCLPGQSCTYEKYSLTCVACPRYTASDDGIQCNRCPAAKQPNENQTGCTNCTGNTYSDSGICEPCIGQATEDHVHCNECPINQVASPWQTGCRCNDGHYNASRGFIACHDHDYDPDALERDETYAVAMAQFEASNCIVCPACIRCDGDGMKIRAGFNLPPTAGAETKWNGTGRKDVLRCRRGNTVDPIEFDEAVRTLVISSHDIEDTDDKKAQCLGMVEVGRVACAHGHEGPLCGKCSAGFGTTNENRCVPCDEALQPAALAKTIGLIGLVMLVTFTVLIAVSFTVVDVYGETLGQDTGKFTLEDLHKRYGDGDDDDMPQSEQDVQGLFEKIDEDLSGTIERKELAHLAQALGVTLSRQQLDAVMLQMDADRDGAPLIISVTAVRLSFTEIVYRNTRVFTPRSLR